MKKSLYVLALMGTSLLLSCHVAGNPPEESKFQWSFSGHEIFYAPDMTDAKQKIDGVFMHHVRAGARGGNGSFEAPFATPEEAVSASSEGGFVYLWPGNYETQKSGVRVRVDNLTLAGATHSLALSSSHLLPPQAPHDRTVLWQAHDLWDKGDSSPQPTDTDKAPILLDKHISPGVLLHVENGLSLTLSGLTLMMTENSGNAIVMANKDEETINTSNSGILTLSNCTIHGFSTAIQSQGPIRLTSGNILEKSTAYAIATNGHQSAAIILENNNIIRQASRGGIFAPNGRVTLQNDNSVTEIGDEGIFARDIVIGNGNRISLNQKHGLYANNSITLENQNVIDGNRESGLHAKTIVLGNGNTISANQEAGITAEKIVTIGNDNILRDNEWQGVMNRGREGSEIITVGDRNIFSGNGKDGIQAQRGIIVLGIGNKVFKNGTFGIMNFGQEVRLRHGNQITENAREGIDSSGAVILGGGNRVTGNAVEQRGYFDLRAERGLQNQPDDTIGTVAP